MVNPHLIKFIDSLLAKKPIRSGFLSVPAVSGRVKQRRIFPDWVARIGPTR